MTVRVRFAPSPTGYLHIGGARTALYQFLYARAKGGSYILRIEDTDLDRSTRAFEEAQIADLKWLGINHSEGPDIGGEYGPYRQSERIEIYNKIAEQFIAEGKAYPCFLTSAELDSLTEKANEEKIAPHTYHGQYRDYDKKLAADRIAKGEEYSIRFKNPGKKWSFTDHSRGEVTFPEDMVGDFVIIRSNKMPVYNYCCAVDDHLMKITHVIRAEEHLNNTVRQLMIYDALNATPPEFCHVSLLVGEDRQKLSKRHGATSVLQYKEQNYLPEAMNNYLCLLGWSHPEEKDIFDVNELGALFEINRFSKSSALYDIKKLNFVNEQWLRKLSDEQIANGISAALTPDNNYNQQSQSWKIKFASVMKEKIQLFSDVESHLPIFFSPEAETSDEQYIEAISWETTSQIKNYLKEQVLAIATDFIEESKVDEWMNFLKTDLKIKGKPLFMGTRVCLTGRAHGPDLKSVVGLTPINIIKKRLE